MWMEQMLRPCCVGLNSVGARTLSLSFTGLTVTEGQGWFLAVRSLCGRQKQSLLLEQAALEHDRSSRWGGIGLSIILVLSVTHSLIQNELLSQNLIPTVLVLHRPRNK